MEWHTIIEGAGQKPAKDQVVIGYWIQGVHFAELCYYDNDEEEWYSCDQNDCISEPDYWIELPQ